ncbi:MAG: glycosyltransferase [Sedimentisphaerales bacterium]|nr:glycosyltransferase [Sedimentisphaerales bacterium]
MNNNTEIIIMSVFWLSLAATLYTYFFYPLLLTILTNLTNRRHRQLSEQTDPLALTDEKLPTVTMVISAYNERNILPEKIANCHAINYPADKIRFLIGSDGSDDGSARILHNINDPRFQTVISRIRRGKVQMLNRLIKLTTSDLVVFSDANTMYEPNAVIELVKKFNKKNVGAVIGKLELFIPNENQISTCPNENPEAACRTENLYWRYENKIKQMESDLASVPTINGGIFAIRRELYEDLPTNSVTEDQVLGMKIMTRRWRCLFAHRARAREAVSTWTGELQRRIRISAGNFQSLFLVPAILNPRLGWISFAFISHKLLRWLVPFFLLAMLAANLLLAGQLFYGSTLIFQAIFYTTAICSSLLPKLTGILKFLSIPRYFLAMNFAILLGLLRFLRGRQRVTWVKTQR